MKLKIVLVKAASAGDIELAQGWKFNQVSIQTKDNSILNVKNSAEMNLTQTK